MMMKMPEVDEEELENAADDEAGVVEEDKRLMPEVDEEELENAADDEVGVVEEDKWLMKNVDGEMTELDLHIFARRLQIAD